MSSVEIRVNEERCKGILECKEQIQYWKSKLEVLEKEQELCIKLARLRLDAKATWNLLSREERQDKRLIIAAMESEELPDALASFPNSSFPPDIRLDRDILMARVSRKDFAQSFSGERLFVPPKLRSNKEIIMTIIPLHPQVIESISCELRDDEDVLRAVLSLGQLPAHFLQHFSTRLRNNKDIIFDIIRNSEGLSSLAFCSHELRNETEFFLKVIEIGNHSAEPQALKYASQRLRDDFDVVYKAVCKSGLNLKHASYALRRTDEIVIAATMQDPKAFRYCLPGSLKQELLEDREFVTKVVQYAPSAIMKSCVNIFNADKEIVLRALVNGLEWSSVPVHLKHQNDFVLQAIQRNPSVYMSLQAELQENWEVALQVVKSENSSDEVILETMERRPEFLADREVMMIAAKNWSAGVLEETLRFSPLEIRRDKAIMIEAIKNVSKTFEYCAEELFEDRNIVMAAVEQSPDTLFYTEDDFQLQNPDIISRAIESTTKEDLWSTYDEIHIDLWANRDVALTWIRQGGEYLKGYFSNEFSEDREFLLEVVRHNWRGFLHASEELKNDKDFMLQILAIAGRAICLVDTDLRYDEDLLMAAISQDPRSLEEYSNGTSFEFIFSFAQGVRKSLANYQVFVEEILGNISSPRCASKCALPMLNQGPTTVAMYEKTLSSYLGLLQGDEIFQYKLVSKHLLLWGL